MESLDPAHRCLNCGAAAPRRYCPECGQSTAPDESGAAALREVLRRSVGPQARARLTLLRLVGSPGGLTIDHMAGRRARHLRPLRLYLAVSVCVFAAAHVLDLNLVFRVIGNHGLHLLRGPHSVPDPADVWLSPIRFLLEHVHVPAVQWFGALSVDERFALLRARRSQSLSTFLLLLVPALAAALATTFGGRGVRPGRHVVFALHFQTFVLLVLLLESVLPAWAANLLSAWTVVYFLVALHRAYGLAWPGTLVRGGIALLLYLGAFFFVNVALTVALIVAAARATGAG